MQPKHCKNGLLVVCNSRQQQIHTGHPSRCAHMGLILLAWGIFQIVSCLRLQDDQDTPVSSPYDPAALNPEASDAVDFEAIQQQLAALHLHRYTPITRAHRRDHVPGPSSIG